MYIPLISLIIIMTSNVAVSIVTHVRWSKRVKMCSTMNLRMHLMILVLNIIKSEYHVMFS